MRDAITLVNNAGNPSSLLGPGADMPAGWASQISDTFGVNAHDQFDASLNAQTITLSGTWRGISASVTIAGLGAYNLNISGDNQSRVFVIDAGASASPG